MAGLLLSAINVPGEANLLHLFLCMLVPLFGHLVRCVPVLSPRAGHSLPGAFTCSAQWIVGIRDVADAVTELIRTCLIAGWKMLKILRQRFLRGRKDCVLHRRPPQTDHVLHEGAASIAAFKASKLVCSAI